MNTAFIKWSYHSNVNTVLRKMRVPVLGWLVGFCFEDVGDQCNLYGI